jgi:predicted metalloprotease
VHLLRAAIVVLLIALSPSHVLAGDRSVDDIPGLPGALPVEPLNDDTTRFARRVLANMEATWTHVFEVAGRDYRPPTLVLFSGVTGTPCGTVDSAMEPLYCPLDEKIYLDPSLLDEFAGDFAKAYVIAHEVGHHILKLLGVTDSVKERAKRASLQVRMELQADCLVGVWVSLNDQVTKQQARDVEAGLIMLQKRSFTRVSSKQRITWFRKGLESGKMSVCGTFGASDL